MHELHVIRTLYLRDIMSVLFSPFLYLLAILACAAASSYAAVFLVTVSSLSVMVSSDPLRVPLVFTTMAAAAFLGVSSCVAIAHEREQGTLEVLFYGPVTPGERIAALFLRDLSVFLIVVIMFFVEAFLVSLTTNLTLGYPSLEAAAFSVPLVCPMVAFSLFISAALRKTRSAVLLFVGLFLLLSGLQLAVMILESVSAENASLFIMYLRRALSVLLSWVQWVSPFGYISRVGEFLQPQGSAAWWIAGIAVLYALALLVVASLLMKKRGTS